jgi:hypothetical protein
VIRDSLSNFISRFRNPLGVLPGSNHNFQFQKRSLGSFLNKTEPVSAPAVCSDRNLFARRRNPATLHPALRWKLQLSRDKAIEFALENKAEK